MNSIPTFFDSDGVDNVLGTADDDFRIMPGTIGVDAGNSPAVNQDSPFDLDGDGNLVEPLPFDLGGNPRMAVDEHTADTGVGGPPIVDIGAYEAQPIRYVNDNAAGLNNGLTWSDAYNFLQDALAEADAAGGAVTQIWVAEGTYTATEKGCTTAADCGGGAPNSCVANLCVWNQPRLQTFQLLDGVALYGGFAGGETSLNQRNITANPTILSGDLVGNDAPVACTQDLPDCNAFGGRCLGGTCILKQNFGDNSCRVAYGGAGLDATAVLDGFTLMGGNGSLDPVCLTAAADSGAGLAVQNSSPTIRQCRFEGNRAAGGGGALHLNSSNSLVEDCTFSRNYSQNGSGGLANSGAGNPTIRGCVFTGNSGGYIGGAGCNSSGGTYEDCAFHDNRSALDGGAVGMGSCNLSFRRCDFFDNRAGASGGAADIQGSLVRFHGCRFGGNFAGNHGGGMSSRPGGTSIEIVNCWFSANVAAGFGGGLFHDSGDAFIIQTTFWSNQAIGANGGGIQSSSATLSLSNSILYRNSSVAGGIEADQLSRMGGNVNVGYTIIEGLTGALGGPGNSDADPFFVDADGPDNTVGTIDDDFRLCPDSPAIDAGNTTAIFADTDDADGDGNTTERYPIDLAAKPRILDDPATADTGVPGSNVVDMGAHEFFTDCNDNGLPDVCDLDCGLPDGPCDLPGCGTQTDCNGDGILDDCGVPVDCNHNEVQKLLPLDGYEVQYFGWSVALWQNRTVTGAVYDDELGTDAGSIYVYEFNGATWNQSAKLLANDGSAYDWLGNAVAIDGTRVVGGAPQVGQSTDGPGAAYVFEITGGIWSQTAKLTASDGDVNDGFGFSVELSGNRIVVGAKDDDDAGNNSGSAYIFEHNGTQWNQVAKLTASDGAANDIFGVSVAISGDVAIVGAPYCLPSSCAVSSEPGAAYIFRFNGSSWIEEIKLTANDPEADDRFGRSVAIDGNRAVVGAQNGDGANDDTGSLYVFDYNGTWQQTTKLFASDGVFHQAFAGGGGAPLALSGDRILAGAPSDYPPTNVGSAYLFAFNGVSWTESFKITANEVGDDDIFGISVALDGDRAVVGASRQDDFGNQSGAVYYFDFSLGDCNCNGIADVCELGADCDQDGVLDECEIADCIGDLECDDCNNNGIPDSCDLDDCTGTPACDDCNLNGVPDGCDIASCMGNPQCLDVNPADGIPDGCVSAVADAGCTPPDDRDWTCFDNWPDTLNGGAGGYPDNQPDPGAEAGLIPTVGGFSLLLDEDVEIDGLRINAAGTLELTQAGPQGDLILGTPPPLPFAGPGPAPRTSGPQPGPRSDTATNGHQDRKNEVANKPRWHGLSIDGAFNAPLWHQLPAGASDSASARPMTDASSRGVIPPVRLAVNDGGLIIGTGRSVVLHSGEAVVGAGGSILMSETGPPPVEGNFTIQGPNCDVDFSGCSLSLLAGTTCFEQGGSLELTDAAEMTLGGHLILDGRAVPPMCNNCSGARGVIPPPKYRGTNGSRSRVAGSIAIWSSGSFVQSASNPLELGGDLDNQSQRPECFDWITGGLTLDNVTEPGQRFEVAGADVGATIGGFYHSGHSNFAIGEVTVAAGAGVHFVNDWANTVGKQACQEALYVGDLTLGSGATLIVDNCRVYYVASQPEGLSCAHPNVQCLGCGSLTAIPLAVTCDFDPACGDGSVCTNDCRVGDVCVHQEIGVLGYGDSALQLDKQGEFSSVVDVDDILCALDAFSGIFSRCPHERADMVPCARDVCSIPGDCAASPTGPLCISGHCGCVVDADCAGVPCAGGRCAVLDVDDILAMLDAFTGIFACPTPWCGP